METAEPAAEDGTAIVACGFGVGKFTSATEDVVVAVPPVPKLRITANASGGTLSVTVYRFKNVANRNF
jgi:hypothetical protein